MTHEKKNQFFHDLNSDLSAIFNAVEVLIEHHDLPEETKKILELINQRRQKVEKNIQNLFKAE